VRSLFQAVDWIGVSAYAGMPRYPSLADIETSLRLVDREMNLFGMNLRGLGKEIIFSEYGELLVLVCFVCLVRSRARACVWVFCSGLWW
jgi:hypothetical protein